LAELIGMYDSFKLLTINVKSDAACLSSSHKCPT